MSVYTTKDKVLSMFRDIRVEATDTVITDSEIAQFISEADAEINAKLNKFYQTPIDSGDSPESFLILGRISKLKVAHTMKTILEMQKQSSDKEQDVQTNLEKKADQLLSDLLPTFNTKANRWDDAIMPLPDAVAKALSPTTDGLFNSNSLNTSTEPVFKKNGDNW